MARLLSRKGLISLALIFIPVILLMIQQMTGIIPLREGTADAGIFSLLMGLCTSAGFAYQEYKPRAMLRNFIISGAFLIGLPMLISGVAAMNDAVNGTTLTGGLGYWFALDTLGSQVAEWSVLIQTIVGIVPVAVLIVGIVGIYLADSPDEMQTPIIETIAAIVLMVIAALLFGWLGVDIF